ncbi:hypothetical protein KBT16_08215, partial [Nostoc sp. CCCryo 231-06]|nr:hypothetical protein [Nostoc sp. CCCryo 231-06]
VVSIAFMGVMVLSQFNLFSVYYSYLAFIFEAILTIFPKARSHFSLINETWQFIGIGKCDYPMDSARSDYPMDSARSDRK